MSDCVVSSCPLEAPSEQTQPLSKPSKPLHVHDEDPLSWQASKCHRLQKRNEPIIPRRTEKEGHRLLSIYTTAFMYMTAIVTISDHLCSG
jgi:hypothetical protein